MQVFISFAEDAEDEAREIASAIVAEGHRVWMRPNDLPAGSSARAAIAAADFFVFIASPQALAAGQVTLSDLAQARAKWKNPRASILPIVIGGATREQLPSFLAALDPIVTEGSLAADVANLISVRLQRPGRQIGWAWGAAVCGLGLFVGVAGYYALQRAEERRFAAISQAIDVEIGNLTQYLSLGQIGKYKLHLNSPPGLKYTCKAGPSKSSNIVKVTHDARCDEIAVHITDGPVRGPDGTPYNWGQAEGIKLEVVPYTIEVEGRQVYLGQFTVFVRNPSLIAGFSPKDSISSYLKGDLPPVMFGCDALRCAFEARGRFKDDKGRYLSLCHPDVKDVMLTVGGKSTRLDRSICARDLEERYRVGLCASSITLGELLVPGETVKLRVELDDGTNIERDLPIALKLKRDGLYSDLPYFPPIDVTDWTLLRGSAPSGQVAPLIAIRAPQNGFVAGFKALFLFDACMTKLNRYAILIDTDGTGLRQAGLASRVDLRSLELPMAHGEIVVTVARHGSTRFGPYRYKWDPVKIR